MSTIPLKMTSKHTAKVADRIYSLPILDSQELGCKIYWHSIRISSENIEQLCYLHKMYEQSADVSDFEAG